MLRRIANHLFWTARNLERAEWRARLVNVNYHLLVESPPEDSEPWAPLLAITGEREIFARYCHRGAAAGRARVGRRRDDHRAPRAGGAGGSWHHQLQRQRQTHRYAY